MATKIDPQFVSSIKRCANNTVDAVNTLVNEVERLEGLCEKYEVALQKVATCKDDDHAVLKTLGSIASEALSGGVNAAV